MNKLIPFLLLILLFSLNLLTSNTYASASQIPGKNEIKVSGTYANDNGSAIFSYDASQIKGIGIETVLGKMVAFAFPNLTYAVAPVIVFKNGRFQDIKFWVGDKNGAGAFQEVYGNGGAIWAEVNVRTICPTECAQFNMQWRDQTATKGVKGSCVCEAIPTGRRMRCRTFDVVGQPITENEFASTICPFTCDSQHAKWNGQWSGTACGCVVCGYK